MDNASKKAALRGFMDAGTPVGLLAMGTLPAFQSAGFKKVGTAGKRRHIMRLIMEQRTNH